MAVQPYLFFDGRAEEALDYYRKTLGAEVLSLMRFKENPDQGAQSMSPPNSGEKVMHASFRIGDSTLMASDGYAKGNPVFQGISLSLSVANEKEAEQRFNALADGGKVQMPLGKTFFASRFGMVADKFGVSWMVIAP
jgi:PhnB protein